MINNSYKSTEFSPSIQAFKTIATSNWQSPLFIQFAEYLEPTISSHCCYEETAICSTHGVCVVNVCYIWVMCSNCREDISVSADTERWAYRST